MGDYFAHWLAMAERTDPAKLPKVYFVNWFRRSDTGRWLWPGYGENMRVLEWICQRVEGRGKAVKTPIGCLPAPAALDLTGLRLDRGSLDQLLAVDSEGWKQEAKEIESYYATFGDRLPKALREELSALRERLG
jgi:phosphoenolpyruvate carboxykinase (GTP)